MYNLMNLENIIEEYPILGEKDIIIINFVSCDGIMGTPIGNRLKYLYPEMFNSYKKSCFSNENNLTIGKILLWRKTKPWIINMPIKNNWKEDYSIEYLEEGFKKISEIYNKYQLNNLGIQEGVIPNELIMELCSKLELPSIKFYSIK